MVENWLYISGPKWLKDIFNHFDGSIFEGLNIIERLIDAQLCSPEWHQGGPDQTPNGGTELSHNP